MRKTALLGKVRKRVLLRKMRKSLNVCYTFDKKCNNPSIRMPSRCPPGMVCFPNQFSIFSWPTATLVVIFMIAVGLIISSQRANGSYRYLQSQMQEQRPRPERPIQINVQGGSGGGGDDRYSRSPEAERVWDTPPDYSRIPSPDRPFNIPTQGIPESYQSMGIIKTPDGKLLPLYGRRSISSRDRYNYYTRTDTYNPIPIPVLMKGRDCQDQVGCPELFNGDNVKMSATNETGEVTIYRVRDIVR